MKHLTLMLLCTICAFSSSSQTEYSFTQLSDGWEILNSDNNVTCTLGATVNNVYKHGNRHFIIEKSDSTFAVIDTLGQEKKLPKYIKYNRNTHFIKEDGSLSQPLYKTYGEKLPFYGMSTIFINGLQQKITFQEIFRSTITSETGLLDASVDFDGISICEKGIYYTYLGPKYGVLDAKGVELVSSKYDFIHAISNRGAVLVKDGKSGITDFTTPDTFCEVDTAIIKYAGSGYPIRYLVSRKNDLYGFQFSANDESIIYSSYAAYLAEVDIPDFGSATSMFADLALGNKLRIVAEVSETKKFRILDETGTPINNEEYDSVEYEELNAQYDIQAEAVGFFKTEKNGKFSIINLDGEPYTDIQFESIGYDFDGVFYAYKDGKIGVLRIPLANSKGNTDFQVLEDFHLDSLKCETYGCVTHKKKKIGFIVTEYDFRIEPIYDEIIEVDLKSSGSDRYFRKGRKKYHYRFYYDRKPEFKGEVK